MQLCSRSPHGLQFRRTSRVAAQTRRSSEKFLETGWVDAHTKIRQTCEYAVIRVEIGKEVLYRRLEALSLGVAQRRNVTLDWRRRPL